ncbi:MAG: bifunctional molybdenum cofactor biosynthesis protein MoaC/MoaB [bacterium]|nr:bifunctional molybdenum cofactor biosynthesis protein MoaC/MoaB [bacterium]
MIDTSWKIKTLRTAKAVASLKFSKNTYKLAKNKKLVKGDIFEASKIVAALSAKNVSNALPFCHNIPIECVKTDIKLNKNSIDIIVEVKTIARTGCEMEALYAAAVAALNCYDFLKPHDKKIEITSIKLLEKKGGKSDFTDEIPKGFKSGVLVISDSISSGLKKDKAGLEIVKRLKSYGIKKIEYKIIPDEASLIKNQVESWVNKKFNLIVTTGGTGISTRDTTPEAIKPLISKELPIMEAARMYGMERTPYAMLSRGISGITNNTLILTLPGSTRGVIETLNVVFPYVFHIYRVMNLKPHKGGL